MNNLAPMENCSRGVQGNLNWMSGYTVRKYHNHELQTNQRHREEEPHNNHETAGRQTKQSNQLSLPNQDDIKT